jgi:hypothetical protein
MMGFVTDYIMLSSEERYRMQRRGRKIKHRQCYKYPFLYVLKAPI